VTLHPQAAALQGGLDVVAELRRWLEFQPLGRGPHLFLELERKAVSLKVTKQGQKALDR